MKKMVLVLIIGTIVRFGLCLEKKSKESDVIQMKRDVDNFIEACQKLEEGYLALFSLDASIYDGEEHPLDKMMLKLEEDLLGSSSLFEKYGAYKDVAKEMKESGYLERWPNLSSESRRSEEITLVMNLAARHLEQVAKDFEPNEITESHEAEKMAAWIDPSGSVPSWSSSRKVKKNVGDN